MRDVFTPAAGRAHSLVRRGAVLAGASSLVLAGILAGAADHDASVGADIPLVEEPATPAPSAEPSESGPASASGSSQASPARQVPVQDSSLPEAAEAAAPVRVAVDGAFDVPVRAVGVDPDGTMELPASGDVAGWYRFGAAPGDDDGTTVLASHVDTSEGVGEFAALVDVVPDDTVRVTDADGVTHGYTVQTVERFDKTGVPLETIFDRSGDRRLALVTCGGRWDTEAGHYEDNLVVTAVP